MNELLSNLSFQESGKGKAVMETISAQAPAKINIHLAIGPKRADGYHSLFSLFQTVSLFDSITVRAMKSHSTSITIEGMPDVSESSNTMAIATKLFCETTNLMYNVHITSEKRIPLEAGLGGGSSDAATVLKLLNTLSSYPLSREELMEVGLRIGSDIPFFLCGSSTAYVTGRGEHCTRIQGRKDLVGLLCVPTGKGVSTAKAFATLDTYRKMFEPSFSLTDYTALCSMYYGPVSQWSFSNDFRQVLTEFDPHYNLLEHIISDEKECYGGVSGSGSTYCILSTYIDVLQRIRRKIEKIDNVFTLYDIKCLHTADSDVTVSI